jgi:hypothetical protein
MEETFQLNEPKVACEALKREFLVWFLLQCACLRANISQSVFADCRLSKVFAAIGGHFGISTAQVACDSRAFVNDLVRRGHLRGMLISLQCGDAQEPSV